jgi:hypothetical protein
MNWLDYQREVMGEVPQAYLDDMRNNPSPSAQVMPATRTRDQAVLDRQVRARNVSRKKAAVSSGGSKGGGNMATASLNPNAVLANKGMLEFINKKALQQFNTGGPKVFGQSRVAPLGDITNQAINRTRNIATAGTPGLDTANNMVNKTMQGGYLQGSPVFNNLQGMASGENVGNNPYLNRVADTLYRDIGDQVSARFGASGRTGGAYNTQALARGFGDAIAPIFANQYNQDVSNQLTANSLLSRDYDAERNRMLSSAGLLPSLDQLRYSGLSELAAAGRAKDEFAQRRLTDKALRFDANQLRPQNNLAFLSQIAGTAIPGKIPTSTPSAPQPSLGNRLLTGGLLGSSLGSAITGGSLLGTGVGGLLGIGSAFL